jgi:uncharacterized protein
MIIDTHVHLGNIYGFPYEVPLTTRTDTTRHPNKPNLYEQLGFGNIYLGRLNYLFKSMIAASAIATTRLANLPNLQDSFKLSGVDRAVILPIEPYVTTESVLAACQADSRLIPFCSVHPHDQAKKSKLAAYVARGCKGLKIHPVIQKVPPADPALLELIEEAAALDLPVLLHVGWGALWESNYGLVENYRRIITSFPAARFIFAHLGFYQPHRLMELVEKHDHVTCDLSWQPLGIVRQAIDRLGDERLLYGSDWPYGLQTTPLKIIERAVAGNPERRDRILYKNAQRLLNLAA